MQRGSRKAAPAAQRHRGRRGKRGISAIRGSGTRLETGRGRRIAPMRVATIASLAIAAVVGLAPAAHACSVGSGSSGSGPLSKIGDAVSHTVTYVVNIFY